ncbi:hypothetical protein G6O69_39135, partial [Pseudenhygromyxa sp. WMMC2535]|uniref:MopE-related protein n=1 Tax=Pseudenhygromyxa sp. WMMC2535 TaxID=2712867 RepID=UPI0015957CEC
MSARTLVTLTGPTLTFALTLAACGPRYETTEDSNGDALTVGDSADLGDDDDTGGVCENDADCADNPAGPVCDEAVGLCFPECEPGDVDDCYEGPAGTEGVGICTAGTWTCAQDGTWGACVGAVEPSAEICGNDIDEDCDGSLADADADGDGWGACSGDCCDDELLGCVDAHLVNPGAFEVAGNGVDDDCDGEIDEPTTACDAGLSSNSGDGLDYAAALDLCETTTENAPLAERRWGVISAELTLADGSSAPLSVSTRSARPSATTSCPAAAIAWSSCPRATPRPRAAKPQLREVRERREPGHLRARAGGLDRRERRRVPGQLRRRQPHLRHRRQRLGDAQPARARADQRALVHHAHVL